MKAVSVKILIVLFLVIRFSVPLNAALTMTGENPSVSRQTLSTSALNSDNLFSRFQSHRAVMHFGGNEFFDHSSASVTSDILPSVIQTARNSSATVLTLVVGFLCVTLVRDRRKWVAVLYIVLLHPIAVEARHLDHLARNIHFDKYVSVVTGLYPGHIHTLQTEDHNPVNSHSYFNGAEQFGPVQGLIAYTPFLNEMRQISERVDHFYSFPPHLFKSRIFSRPPPAQG